MYEKIKDFKDITNFKSDAYFRINSCGKQNHRGDGYPVLRSHGRVDCHILYITKGECTITDGDREIPLAAGRLKIYKPHEKQQYKFNPPFTQSYWIHFTGIGAEEILKQLNLWIKSIYDVGIDENIIHIFDELIRETTLKEYQYQTICEGKLIELLGYISRAATEPSSAGKHRLIYDIIEQMRENPTKKINFEKTAAMYDLSRSTFEHLFKDVTGLPPYRYQLRLRLDRALYLLKNTELNVSEIAYMTGFDDALYFSRIFKKTFGCSPTEYRAKGKNNT